MILRRAAVNRSSGAQKAVRAASPRFSGLDHAARAYHHPGPAGPSWRMIFWRMLDGKRAAGRAEEFLFTLVRKKKGPASDATEAIQIN